MICLETLLFLWKLQCLDQRLAYKYFRARITSWTSLVSVQREYEMVRTRESSPSERLLRSMGRRWRYNRLFDHQVAPPIVVVYNNAS